MPFDQLNYARPAIPEGHRRLLVLAEFLETVPDEKLSLSSWSEGDNCGTTGCALGWACMIPEFRAAGLGFNKSGVPSYGGREGHMVATLSAAEFFDIPREVARSFFIGSFLTGSEARQFVTSHIRAFVAEQSTVSA